MGVNIKGKTKVFRDCPSKLTELFKKRIKIVKVNEIHIKVLRHIFKKGAFCCIVEVVSKDGVKENI